jgi:hypothetical protein
MADAPNSAQNPVQGTLPLYKSPEPINATQHMGKGLSFTDRPFDFVKTTHFVPVTIGEFGMCASRYPIIFLGAAKMPVAVMGVNANENVFVGDDGRFEQFAYIPGYIRRYPFVSATHSDDKERFTVCVDTGSHLYSDNPQTPFFNADGQPSEFLENSIEFVRRYEAEVAQTQEFVAKMTEMDLFEDQKATFQPRDAQGQPQGETQTIAEYFGISGEKLRAVEPAVLAELRDNTHLGAIYAHMLSLPQWDNILNRVAARAQANAAASAAPAGNVPPPPAPGA